MNLANGTPGDYTNKAEKKLKEALKIQTKLLGIHLDTARSHVCRSDALMVQGELKLALDECKKGLEIRKKVLGPNHEKTKAAREKMEELKRRSREEPRQRYPKTEERVENTTPNGIVLKNFNALN